MGDVKQMFVTFGVVWASSVCEAVDMGSGKSQKFIDLAMDYGTMGRISNGYGIAFRVIEMRAYGRTHAIRISTVAVDLSE